MFAVDSSHLSSSYQKESSLTDAAGIPETGFTVWFNVFHLGKLQPWRENYWSTAATSGIGTMDCRWLKLGAGQAYTARPESDEENWFFLKKIESRMAYQNYTKEAFEESSWKDWENRFILRYVRGWLHQKESRKSSLNKGRLIYTHWEWKAWMSPLIFAPLWVESDLDGKLF